MKKTDKLSKEEAYLTMLFYLNKLYERTNSDDLAGFLGGMRFLDDKTTADSAAWEDWEEAIRSVKSENFDKNEYYLKFED